MKNEINKIIRTALYIRVSSDEQVKHGYSLQSQRERLIDYCKEHNYKIIDIYMDEGKSARSKLRSRTEMQRLIKDAQQKKFDRIIFWRLDRWFRNISDYYKVQEILENNKIDWECTDEEYNTTTSNGRLHLNIKLSIAQNESDQTSDRIKFNFENMVKNGHAIMGKQCLPLGYKVVGEKKNKKIVKDENEKEIVEDMFKTIKNTCSIRKTLIYINEKYNLSIGYYSLSNYLKNGLYIGKYKNNNNYCEPYITENEFNDIQSKIRTNVKMNSKHDYIFSGLIFCKHCGCRFVGNKHKNSEKRKNGKIKVYISYRYRCNKAINEKRCDNKKYISEKVVEKKLFENIEDEINKYEIKYKEIEQKQENKKIDVNKIKLKIERLNDLYIDGRISKEKYDSEYIKFNDVLKEANKKPKKVDLSHLKKLLDKDIIEYYNSLNNVEKRAFWGQFIDRIEIDKDNFDIFFKTCEY